MDFFGMGRRPREAMESPEDCEELEDEPQKPRLRYAEDVIPPPADPPEPLVKDLPTRDIHVTLRDGTVERVRASGRKITGGGSLVLKRVRRSTERCWYDGGRDARNAGRGFPHFFREMFTDEEYAAHPILWVPGFPRNPDLRKHKDSNLYERVYAAGEWIRYEVLEPNDSRGGEG